MLLGFQILLDFTYDCSIDFREPSLTVPAPVTSAAATDDLEQQFANINLNKSKDRMFQTNIDDDEESKDTLNDFHLAEIDLIDCFLRTNIIQRIK